MRKTLAALVALGLAAQNTMWARETAVPKNNVQVTWEELQAIAVERKISTVLPDGTKLQGEVLAVRPESLVLDVHKTSKKKLHPRGQTEIPRPEVSEIRIIRETSALMRIGGGILGAIGGLFATGALVYATNSATAAIPGVILIIPVSAMAGYYAGKLADRRTTVVSIRPVER